MDRLLQLVLVVAIATGSYSYKLQRHELQMPEIPQESNLDEYYPTEYINKLVDALSPKELERLRTVINLHHRDSTPSSSRCAWHSHTFSPTQAKDETGTDYFIIHHKDLPKVKFTADVCNKSGHHCQKDENNDRPTYAYCCSQEMDKITTNVLSEPVKEFRKRENQTLSDAKIIEKDLYINKRCECNEKFLDNADLLNPDAVCKSTGGYL